MRSQHVSGRCSGLHPHSTAGRVAVQPLAAPRICMHAARPLRQQLKCHASSSDADDIMQKYGITPVGPGQSSSSKPAVVGRPGMPRLTQQCSTPLELAWISMFVAVISFAPSALRIFGNLCTVRGCPYHVFSSAACQCSFRPTLPLTSRAIFPLFVYVTAAAPAAPMSRPAGNGVFLLLLLNVVLFVLDHVMHLKGIQTLYLNHARPQWWQWVTHAFCHANFNHLSMNLFNLCVFG